MKASLLCRGEVASCGSGGKVIPCDQNPAWKGSDALAFAGVVLTPGRLPEAEPNLRNSAKKNKASQRGLRFVKVVTELRFSCVPCKLGGRKKTRSSSHSGVAAGVSPNQIEGELKQIVAYNCGKAQGQARINSELRRQIAE
jgi:hypothetical protein